jgi:hypothetical protein
MKKPQIHLKNPKQPQILFSMKSPKILKKKEKENKNYPKTLTLITQDHSLTLKDGYINGKEKILKKIKKV